MILLPAMAMWGMTLYLCRPSALRQVQWNWSESLLTRLFAMAFAVGLTFQVDWLAERLDRALGIGNASWFLGYAFCILGVYCGLAAWLSVRKLSMWRGTLISVSALILLVVLFPFLGAEKENSHDTLFVTPAVLAYSTIVYLWVALMAQEGLAAIRLLLSEEALPTGQLRLVISMLAIYSGCAFVLVRSLTLTAVFFDSSWPLPEPAKVLSQVLLALLGLGFALALGPLRLLAPIAWVWVYLQEQQTLYQMERLRKELVQLTAPLPWPAATWRERLWQPSYALYCTLIEVLDRRTLLLAQAQGAAPQSRWPPKLDWLFAPLPETEDWVDLLLYIHRNLNRHRPGQMQVTSHPPLA